MKKGIGFVVCLFFATCFHCVNGQDLNDVIAIELSNESLESCFRAIERHAGFLFAFLPEQVDRHSNISLPNGTRTVSKTLDIILKDTRLAYVQKDNIIVIYQKRDRDLTHRDKKILISGKVTGLGKDPLSDVNVVVNGTNTGTTTHKGHYSILAKGNDVLIFSMVGYKQAKIPVNNRTVIDLSLQHQIPMLEPVEVDADVNTRYEQGSVSEQTGSIVGIDASDIGKQPVSNFLLALQGRATGVYVQQLTGVAGGAAAIQIRGTDKPMFIVDGVPFAATGLSSAIMSGKIIPNGNPLSNINPADIESIEILKDADATAIYGARGRNGVVLVTTKRAGKEKAGIDVNFYQGIANVTRTMDLLNTQQYVQMRKEAFKNDGVEPSAVNAPDLMLWDTTQYTNWQKTLIGRTAKIMNAQASLSGGDAHTHYLFSSTYYRESTVFPGEFAFQRGTAHFHFNHIHPNKKLKFSLLSTYSLTHNYLPKTDLTRTSITLLPNMPDAYDKNGNLNWQNATGINPFALIKQEYIAKTDNVVSQATLEYKILNGLHLRGSFGYHKMQVTEIQKNPISSFDPAQKKKGYAYSGNSSVNTWIAEPMAEYHRTIKNKGSLLLLAGIGFRQTANASETILATGYANDKLLENLLAASAIHAIADEGKQCRYKSVFGRVNYNHQSKYIVNLSARRDEVNKSQYAHSWAAGTAWVFSEEPFMQWPALSFGKLRMNYGILTGNFTTGNPYFYENTLDPYFFGTSKKAEAAIDFGFFENRLFFSTGYYYSLSDKFTESTSAPITDKPVQYYVPAVAYSSGVELALNSANVARDNFTWRTFLNVTVPGSRLKRYSNPLQKIYHSTGVDAQTGIYTFQEQGLKKPLQRFYGGIENSIQLGNLHLDILIQVVKQTGENYLAVFHQPPGTRFSNQPALVMERWQQGGDIANIQRFTQSGTAFTAYVNAAQYSDLAISDASYIRIKNVSLSWYLKKEWLEKMKMKQGRIYLQAQNLLTISGYRGYDPESLASGALPPLWAIASGLEFIF